MAAEEPVPTPVIERIYESQRSLWSPLPQELPDHHPDTLFIGCIDARLDPHKDIGIPYGNALMLRTIAALVPQHTPGHPEQDMSEAIHSALEHGIKHIVVMGHTHCGGLEACVCNHEQPVPKSEALPDVHAHLGIIRDAASTNNDTCQDTSRLEAASMHISLEHLLSYPEVLNAKAAGDITVDGWIIDTHTRQIQTYDQKSQQLHAMERTRRTPGTPIPSDTLEAVRSFIPPAHRPGENPSVHAPELLMLSDLDARISPAEHLNMPYGKSLIFRGFNPCDTERTDEKAAIQFAVEGKKVKDVVLMLHTDSDKYKDLSPEEERAALKKDLHNGINSLKANPVIHKARKAEPPEIRLHAWLIDTHTRRISELNDRGMLVPLGISSEVAQGFIGKT